MYEYLGGKASCVALLKDPVLRYQLVTFEGLGVEDFGWVKIKFIWFPTPPPRLCQYSNDSVSISDQFATVLHLHTLLETTYPPPCLWKPPNCTKHPQLLTLPSLLSDNWYLKTQCLLLKEHRSANKLISHNKAARARTSFPLLTRIAMATFMSSKIVPNLCIILDTTWEEIISTWEAVNKWKANPLKTSPLVIIGNVRMKNTFAKVSLRYLLLERFFVYAEISLPGLLINTGTVWNI